MSFGRVIAGIAVGLAAVVGLLLATTSDEPAPEKKTAEKKPAADPPAEKPVEKPVEKPAAASTNGAAA